MTVVLTKEVETFVEEQVRAGVAPNAATFVNDVLPSLSENHRQSVAATPKVETWLLEAAGSPATPLLPTDFDAIRQRVRASLSSSAT